MKKFVTYIFDRILEDPFNKKASWSGLIFVFAYFAFQIGRKLFE